MKITYDFACQDDCLDKMVPSDLRQLVNERDQAHKDVSALIDQNSMLQDERDALVVRAVRAEIELAKTVNDYNIARDRHDTLAAHIERLQAERDCHHAWQDKACIIFTRISESEEAVIDSDVKQIINSELMYDIGDFLNETPQQCLRDVRAEAGRDGYYEGFRAGIVTSAPLLPPQSSASAIDHFKLTANSIARVKAEEYADKVRQGGE